MKKINISLKPNEDKLYKATVTQDNEVVQEDLIQPHQVKRFVDNNVEPEVVGNLRLATKLFKCKSLTFHKG